MENYIVYLIVILLPLLFLAGYRIGKRDQLDSAKSKRIEEYSFYPFITNEQGIVEFSQPLFNEAVRYFIKHKNAFASRQLILIGEQNIVRDILASAELNNYLLLYTK